MSIKYPTLIYLSDKAITDVHFSPVHKRVQGHCADKMLECNIDDKIYMSHLVINNRIVKVRFA